MIGGSLRKYTTGFSSSRRVIGCNGSKHGICFSWFSVSGYSLLSFEVLFWLDEKKQKTKERKEDLYCLENWFLKLKILSAVVNATRY